MAMSARRFRAASWWPTILLIVGAGVVSALQVGKAPLLTATGWRGFWLVNAAVLVGYEHTPWLV